MKTNEKNLLELVGVAVLTAAFALSASAQLPVAGRPVPSLSSFDDTMQLYMDYYDINAGVLAVSVNGNVVYQRGFGTSIPENTPFRLASVEKPITAAAIERLVAAGQLNYADNVFDLGQPGGGILSYQPFNGSLGDERLQNITVMDLLNHQGGWRRQPTTNPFNSESDFFDPQFETIQIAWAMGLGSPAGPDEIIRYMLTRPLDFVPGMNGCTTGDPPRPFYCYSNFGYMLLGKIVEAVSGRSLLQYVRENILTPSMDVPNQELIFGRTYDSANSVREPYYQCSRCSVTDVFFPFGPPVENPYGGWHHEAFLGHGNLVASAGPLLEYMNRYQVGVQQGAGLPLAPGSTWSGTFNGAIDGITTCVMQRGDGVNIVVLLSKRVGDIDHGNEVAGLISAIINNSSPTWPTTTSDGFWTDFAASGSGLQRGGYHHPFRTMPQALAVGAGARVRLKPGTTDWTGTISHRVRFDAPLGPATIGR